MGNRRQFKANLKSHNHAWLLNEALERGISANALLNEILSEIRKKSSPEMVPKPCVTSRVQ